MKKDYMKPSIRMVEAETEDMIALSMVEGKADTSPVLSREADVWPDTRISVWNDEE